jgi:hypothetical protein
MIEYAPMFIIPGLSLNEYMFLGLSIFWIPSILLTLFLTRKFLNIYFNIYEASLWYYFPVLFILITPHTLFELFSFNGSHLFAGLIEIFFMYSAIMAMALFVFTRKFLYLTIFSISFLLINYQTFPLSIFIFIILFFLFSLFSFHQGKRYITFIISILLTIILTAFEFFVGITKASFPFQNLNIPNPIMPTDPNYRVFLLSTLNPSKTVFNILSLQYFAAEGPYFQRITIQFYILI